MKRLENVNLFAEMQNILNLNTFYYASDFEFDKEMIRECAASKNPEDKHLLWMSRESGTWCTVQSKALIKGTPQHSVWTTSFEGMMSYMVHITGMENDQPIGTMIKVPAEKLRQYIEKNAVESNFMRLTFKDGHEETHQRRPHAPVVSYGEVKSVEYLPDDEEALRDAVHEMRQAFMKRR